MPRIPDASDMIRKKRLEIVTASNQYLDPLKFRVALPSISYYNRFALQTVLPNFLVPTKVLPSAK